MFSKLSQEELNRIYKFNSYVFEASKFKVVVSIMFWLVTLGVLGFLFGGWIMSTHMAMYNWEHPTEGLFFFSGLAGFVVMLFSFLLGYKLGQRFWFLRTWGLATEFFLSIMMAPVYRDAKSATDFITEVNEIM